MIIYFQAAWKSHIVIASFGDNQGVYNLLTTENGSAKTFQAAWKIKTAKVFGLSLFVFLIKMRGQQVAHPTPPPSLRAVIYHCVRNILTHGKRQYKRFSGSLFMVSFEKYHKHFVLKSHTKKHKEHLTPVPLLVFELWYFY